MGLMELLEMRQSGGGAGRTSGTRRRGGRAASCPCAPRCDAGSARLAALHLLKRL